MSRKGAVKPLLNMLFVCTGNTCRSPMAVGIMRKLLASGLKWRVSLGSAGVSAFNGEPASRWAREVSRKHGIDLSTHRARRVTKEIAEASDLILGMQAIHVERIKELCPSRIEHTFLITELGATGAVASQGIADPMGGDEEAYSRCFAEIEECLKRGMGFLTALMAGRPAVG
ncbi:MAG: low molecular weight protein arginine phosphatase [Candidatus Eisenbacteria bacterium]